MHSHPKRGDCRQDEAARSASTITAHQATYNSEPTIDGGADYKGEAPSTEEEIPVIAGLTGSHAAMPVRKGQEGSNAEPESPAQRAEPNQAVPSEPAREQGWQASFEAETTCPSQPAIH